MKLADFSRLSKVNLNLIIQFNKLLKVLTETQHHRAAKNEYNFDHPQAFDFDLMCETVRRLREGKNVEVCHFEVLENPKLVNVFKTLRW